MRDDINETSDTALKLLLERDKHLINELERMNGCLATIKKDLIDFKLKMTEDISTLKVKAKVWGVMGGAIIMCAGVLAWVARAILTK